MELDRESLIDLLGRAFEEGQHGSYDLKDQAVDEIVNAIGKRKSEMAVKELLNLPAGRIVVHPEFGDGLLTIKNGNHYVQFDGFRIQLAEDMWPWTEKLQVIS